MGVSVDHYGTSKCSKGVKINVDGLELGEAISVAIFGYIPGDSVVVWAEEDDAHACPLVLHCRSIVVHL